MNSRKTTVLVGLIIAMFLLLFGFQGNAQEVAINSRSAILWMVKRWLWADGYSAHCWLIPIVSGVIIWRQRDELRSACGAPSLMGLLFVIGSLLLHWGGVRAQLTRVSLFSMICLMWSIPYYLCGRRVGVMLLFPCAYLIFCIPLTFLDPVTFKLRMFATATSAQILNGLGVTVVRTGTIIEVLTKESFKLDVAAPCSGLKSLLALMALAAPYAWFTQKTQVKKWVLFVSSVPLAIAGNVVRILVVASLGLLVGKRWAFGFSHYCSGLIVFAVAVCLMFWVGHLLKINYREKFERWKKHAQSIACSS